MKRIIFSFLLLTGLLSVTELTAQKVKKDDGKGKTVKHEPVATASIRAFLGKSELSGGTISKQNFDTYLKQGLTAKDSAGNAYKINGFTFSYGERNLYEDSVGNLMVLTDYLTEFCPGDTITPAIANNIFYKTKPGDTAYFDNIKVLTPDGKQVKAKAIKFVLTK